MRIPTNGSKYEVIYDSSSIKSKLQGDFSDLRGNRVNPSREFGLGSKEALVVINDKQMSSSDVNRLSRDLSSYKSSVVVLVENISDSRTYENNFSGFSYIIKTR